MADPDLSLSGQQAIGSGQQAGGPMAPLSVRSKIHSLDGLAALARQAQQDGRTVALCHGVFDLLHLGHVRHIEAARREADVLFVTLTCDEHVNKGPGRPVFTEQLRAEMLAALAYVDAVGINYAPSAETVIHAVRPDVYIKGSDYADADQDVTGKIRSERDAVESHGGRLVFTDEVTFSSSTLINKYLNVYDPSLQHYLETLRDEGTLETLLGHVERLQELRVLFVGDAIIDEYDYVNPMGKAAKENIIASLFHGKELFAGGIIAAANHAASVVKSVDVLTCVGSADSHEELIRQTVRDNVTLHLLQRDNAPTTRKVRYIDAYSMRKLFEVYHMDDSYLHGELKQTFDTFIAEHAADYDLVVVCDFGHGLIDGKSIDLLEKHARFLAVNAQSNAANIGFNMITKYPKADYIAIDANEARLAAHDKVSDMSEVVSEMLPRRIDCPNIIVTQGKHGCLVYQRDQGLQRIPALTSTIVDTVGAGDAFFAVTAPAVALGVPMKLVGFLGNAAGAIKVGIVGHRTSVEKAPLVKFLTALLK